MPLDHTRFTRRRPADPDASLSGVEASARLTQTSTARTEDDPLRSDDLSANALLEQILYELKHIRLHMEAMSGEDFRGDVGYADQ